MRWHTHVCAIVFAGWAVVTTSQTYAEGQANEWAVVEAYALANVSAEDGARLIRQMIPAGADFDVVPDARSNSLIVAGPPRIQERVAGLWRMNDQSPATRNIGRCMSMRR